MGDHKNTIQIRHGEGCLPRPRGRLNKPCEGLISANQNDRKLGVIHRNLGSSQATRILLFSIDMIVLAIKQLPSILCNLKCITYTDTV